jgi:hypothetical protein
MANMPIFSACVQQAAASKRELARKAGSAIQVCHKEDRADAPESACSGLVIGKANALPMKCTLELGAGVRYAAPYVAGAWYWRICLDNGTLLCTGYAL